MLQENTRVTWFKMVGRYVHTFERWS
uniref:Uncharacterized protein n=1 Tax=Rhizophora mucronata TaxID=61149 RepID=A0A2P2PHB0_RHIMU